MKPFSLQELEAAWQSIPGNDLLPSGFDKWMLQTMEQHGLTKDHFSIEILDIGRKVLWTGVHLGVALMQARMECKDMDTTVH